MKKMLTDQMTLAAQKKEFERAARFRDLLLHTETFEITQVAAVPNDFFC
jgi:excinuclease UvrABC nuclease subunit